jgi:hypothetical protein
MAKRRIPKRSPEEVARWRANQDRLEQIAERGLRELGISREELHRRLGLPRPPRR